MPEMPEVQGLVDYLAGRLPGLTVTRATVANIAALKTPETNTGFFINR